MTCSTIGPDEAPSCSKSDEKFEILAGPSGTRQAAQPEC